MIYSYICLRENNKTKGPKHDLQLHMFEREQYKLKDKHDLQLHTCLRENNRRTIYSYICLRENNKTKGPKHDLQLHMFEREQ